MSFGDEEQDMPEHETQTTIAIWADETFGKMHDSARAAVRANEEMAELLRVLTTDGATADDAGSEIADVVICLYRLANGIGVDLRFAIDQKMAKNRARKWVCDGMGHGYHVDE